MIDYSSFDNFIRRFFPPHRAVMIIKEIRFWGLSQKELNELKNLMSQCFVSGKIYEHTFNVMFLSFSIFAKCFNEMCPLQNETYGAKCSKYVENENVEDFLTDIFSMSTKIRLDVLNWKK